MVRRTLASCAAGALALFVVFTPAAPQAQGQGGPPAQPGQQGGLQALQARLQALEALVQQLQANLASEIAARTALQNNVNAEAAARTAADSALQNDIASEAAARAAANTALRGNIGAETAARAAADATLQGNIEALQTRITTLGDQVTVLHQLFQSLNPAVNTAQQNIAGLRTDLDVLAGTVAMLKEDQSTSQLNGLWEFTVVNLTPPGFLPDPILLLGNFTRDGSFLNTSTHPESGVPVTTDFGIPTGLFTLDAGQAHWIRRGPRTFVLETWRFVFATKNAEAFPILGAKAGEFSGFVQAQSDVTLNEKGDKMQGRVRFQLLDVNKQPMFHDLFPPGAPPVVGDITGSRVPLIPIPIP